MNEAPKKRQSYFPVGRQTRTIKNDNRRKYLVDLIKTHPSFEKYQIENIVDANISSKLFRSCKDEAEKQIEEQEKKNQQKFSELAESNPAFQELANFTMTYIGGLNEGFKLVNGYWKDYIDSGKATPEQMEIYQDFLMKGALILNAGARPPEIKK